MNLLYSNRSPEDQTFIKRVCNDVLSQELKPQKEKNDFCAVFVDGRNRFINALEDKTAFYSFALFSEYRYPIYCFVNNTDNFLDNDTALINELNISLIKIRPLRDLGEYSDFCINELYFKLPSNIENVITIQSDGFLLKSGYEKWLLDNKIDLIGSHLFHFAAIDCYVSSQYGWKHIPYRPVNMANLGFSYRKASIMKQITERFGKLKLRERHAPNNKYVPEDLFFSFFGWGSGMCKKITTKECCQFAKDPLTPKIYQDKNNLPFGFHYFRLSAEFGECNH